MESGGQHQNTNKTLQCSLPLPSGRECIKLSVSHKDLVEELKAYWKKLWQERVDDKIRAEGVASDEYVKMFVERGTVIHATRDFKALNFREILEKNEIINPDRYVPPSPQVGGWHKFVKTP